MAQTRSTGSCALSWSISAYARSRPTSRARYPFLKLPSRARCVCSSPPCPGSSAVQALAPCSVGLRHDAPGSAAVPRVAARTPLPPTICWLPNGCTLDPIPTQPHHVCFLLFLFVVVCFFVFFLVFFFVFWCVWFFLFFF